MDATITIKIKNIDEWDDFINSTQIQIEESLQEEIDLNPLPFDYDELTISFESK
jgi:hypothetical protein